MINGQTKVLGVIGNPIEHTFSPAMHNAGLEYLGLNYKYLPFLVEENQLKDLIDGAKALNFVGLNVTIPHKINILNYLDEIDPVAKMIGAVNTIKFTEQNGEKIAIGYNTDGYGCVRAINEVIDLKDKNVMVIGAGGASRAISYQITQSEVSNLSIFNRNYKKAQNLIEDIKYNTKNLDLNIELNSFQLDAIEKEIQNYDVLIDTSPIGMYPKVNDDAIVSSEIMQEELVVNDIVYTPKETSLIKEAKKAGCKTIPGYKMLLYQGVKSFEIWLNRDAPVEIMEKSLLDVLGI